MGEADVQRQKYHRYQVAQCPMLVLTPHAHRAHGAQLNLLRRVTMRTKVAPDPAGDHRQHDIIDRAPEHGTNSADLGEGELGPGKLPFAGERPVKRHAWGWPQER